jgi:hypothetical protein
LSLGDGLLKAFTKASDMSLKYRTLADESTALFSPDIIAAWAAIIAAWDEDHDKPSPFEYPESGKFSPSVPKKLC